MRKFLVTALLLFSGSAFSGYDAAYCSLINDTSMNDIPLLMGYNININARTLQGSGFITYHAGSDNILFPPSWLPNISVIDYLKIAGKGDTNAGYQGGSGKITAFINATECYNIKYFTFYYIDLKANGSNNITINRGDTVTFSWDFPSHGLDSPRLMGPPGDTIHAFFNNNHGSGTLQPTVTGDYYMAAYQGKCNDSRKCSIVHITVNDAPPSCTVSLTNSSTDIGTGSSPQFLWTTKNVSSASLVDESGNTVNSAAALGTNITYTAPGVTVTNTTTKSYTLKVSGGGGNATCSTGSINIWPAPTCSLASRVTANWTSGSGVTSAQLEGVSVATSGSKIIRGPNPPSTNTPRTAFSKPYTMTVKNPSGLTATCSTPAGS